MATAKFIPSKYYRKDLAEGLHAGRPRIGQRDQLLEALIREHGPDGRAGIAKEIAAALRRIATAVVLLLASTAVLAEPMPQPKTGQCPSGYRESGGYCAPTSERAPAAVPKPGQCPSNWTQSGAYCVELRRR
jgi:hypothetical protein